METLSRNQLSMIAEVTVGYRPKIRPSQRPTVKCASDAYQVLRNFWNEDQIELRETFFVMLLNTNGRVITYTESVRECFDLPRLMFRTVIQIVRNLEQFAPKRTCNFSRNPHKM